MKMKHAALALTGLLILTASTALAHPGHDHGTDGSAFGTGFAHPIGGLDHILAMVVVGIWAAQRGGRSLWALPLCFVGLMVLGAVGGLAGMPLPFVEAGIAASILVMGLLVAMAARLPLAAAAGIAGLFAVFHGHAHGTELGVGLSAAGYIVGFALSTALLHGAGLLVGLAIQRTPGSDLSRENLLRTAGGTMALAGGLVLVGAL